jgi:thiol:disulfide interchange protein DsbD
MSGNLKGATVSERHTNARRLGGIIILASVAWTLVAGPAAAQGLLISSEKLVTLDVSHSLSVFHPGATGYIAVTARIADGWHVNSKEPLDRYLIPTVLNVTAPDGIEIARILYPAPALRKLEISESRMSLYDGTVVFGAVVRVGRNIPPGRYPLRATLAYQGCNDLTCIEPASAVAFDTIRVGSLDEGVELLAPAVFSKPPFVDDAGEPVGAGGAPSAAGSAPAGGVDFGDILKRRGLALTFLTIFAIGLALNLTPCIYPLIPVTISYFGGQAERRSGGVFVLALLYVLGMSITYSVLGTAAAMTGSLFGAALQNPFVILFIAAVLVALALSMFGLWEIRLPMFIATRTGTAKRGHAGALFMGLTMGLVAAPCVGPFVLGLLAYVSQTGNPLLGFLMFFTLAWGMGAPFLVLGTVSGSISRLPRSGSWLVWVRKIFGFILIGMALYFARYLLGERIATFGYAATALTAGIYLAWIDRTSTPTRTFRMLKNATGIAGIAIAALITIVPAVRQSATGIAWRPYTEEALAAAARDGKSVIIDFSADWCLPCHELDAKTFSDEAVVELASSVVPLRIDLTRSGPIESASKKRFSVGTVPTIIFIDASGAERESLRVSGFVDAREFERRLAKIAPRAIER